MTIGNRIKQRRIALGYTLDDVKELLKADGSPISKASLSKYELDKSIPKALNLYNLSKVLGVSSEYFLKKNNFEINWIAFRKTTKLTKREENRIKSIAKEQVEAQLFLNNILNIDNSEIILPKYQANSFDEIEEIAETIREEWKVFNWPIESITSLLEEQGIFVVDIESDFSFDGLSGIVDDSKPVIITVGEKSIDRKRLNLSHELGHLVLDNKDLDVEKAAFRFAGAFLIEKGSLYKAMGKKRRNIDIRELQLLKEEYGISIQALIRRCYDLDIINHAEFKRLNIYMRANRMHINEPGKILHKEIPIKIKRKLYRAISEGLTTESEVLSRFPNLSKDLNRDIMKNDWNNENEEEKNKALKESAKKLLNEYKDNGPLMDFDIYDDIMEL
ncbi:MAG: helix-turn-helix domain-containing protein [Spirochaetia bacterium]|nr:helix-turn-helix domain-containing protein [Spirochaetia bacterium]MCF7953024.1 helix-turn-helix domain-containing protein [Spirochaetales bacterium]